MKYIVRVRASFITALDDALRTIEHNIPLEGGILELAADTVHYDSQGRVSIRNSAGMTSFRADIVESVRVQEGS